MNKSLIPYELPKTLKPVLPLFKAIDILKEVWVKLTSIINELSR